MKKKIKNKKYFSLTTWKLVLASTNDRLVPISGNISAKVLNQLFSMLLLRCAKVPKLLLPTFYAKRLVLKHSCHSSNGNFSRTRAPGKLK